MPGKGGAAMKPYMYCPGNDGVGYLKEGRTGGYRRGGKSEQVVEC